MLAKPHPPKGIGAFSPGKKRTVQQARLQHMDGIYCRYSCLVAYRLHQGGIGSHPPFHPHQRAPSRTHWLVFFGVMMICGVGECMRASSLLECGGLGYRGVTSTKAQQTGTQKTRGKCGETLGV